jgi:hypothetical protein
MNTHVQVLSKVWHSFKSSSSGPFFQYGWKEISTDYRPVPLLTLNTLSRRHHDPKQQIGAEDIVSFWLNQVRPDWGTSCLPFFTIFGL